MKIIHPAILIDPEELSVNKVTKLEKYGRICYKSEEAITKDSADRFLRSIIKNGHESVIEHEKATVVIITDRGVTHEIVRHRIASYSQESTRYCNYASERFGEEIKLIKPYFYEESSTSYQEWLDTCLAIEKAYLKLVELGKPQEARSVLPNSLKTEIVVTFNFREWRHFFKLRCAASAHPQMRQITIPLLLAFREKLPCLFDDILYDTTFPKAHYAEILLK